jgi:hypothetical protein
LREAWALPDVLAFDTLGRAFDPDAAAAPDFGVDVTGAAAMLATNSKAAIRLDSTRFMQTPLASIDHWGPHKHSYNCMKAQEKMAIAVSSPQNKPVAFLPHL